MDFPLPRTTERLEFLVESPNELQGAEICGFLSSESGPMRASESVDAELKRRRAAVGAVEPRLADYPKLSERLFPDKS